MLNVQAPVVDGVEDNYIIPAVPMPTVLSSPPPTFIPVASFPELVAEASLSHIDEVISPSTDVRDVNEEMLTESGSTHAVATSDQVRWIYLQFVDVDL
jgi:hypothetical protein